jgi:hypothetical protein
MSVSPIPTDTQSLQFPSILKAIAWWPVPKPSLTLTYFLLVTMIYLLSGGKQYFLFASEKVYDSLGTFTDLLF